MKKQMKNHGDLLAAAQQGNREAIRRYCSWLQKHEPGHVDIFVNLGVLAARDGDFAEAIRLYKEGLNKFPDSAALHANLARSLAECRQWQTAYDHARQAAALQPDNYSAWLNLSWACIILGKSREAEVAAQNALTLQPTSVAAWNNLGSALKEQGRVRESVAAYRKVLELDPTYENGHLNMLLTLQYDPNAHLEEIILVARQYARQFESALLSSWSSHPNEPSPWRRLRIGFVSPDLNDHSVLYLA